ncbi:hypothetical protein M569_12327 [Genlisea aurea]|uniref:Uncharacterized protein n=1 Tax=Genlisea aurea TaxID=192259 RepID=S8DI75_9LAMI|nr:hypothetical protein M569_12327 [Genlisea aurea]
MHNGFPCPGRAHVFAPGPSLPMSPLPVAACPLAFLCLPSLSGCSLSDLYAAALGWCSSQFEVYAQNLGEVHYGVPAHYTSPSPNWHCPIGPSQIPFLHCFLFLVLSSPCLPCLGLLGVVPSYSPLPWLLCAQTGSATLSTSTPYHVCTACGVLWLPSLPVDVLALPTLLPLVQPLPYLFLCPNLCCLALPCFCHPLVPPQCPSGCKPDAAVAAAGVVSTTTMLYHAPRAKIPNEATPNANVGYVETPGTPISTLPTEATATTPQFPTLPSSFDSGVGPAESVSLGPSLLVFPAPSDAVPFSCRGWTGPLELLPARVGMLLGENVPNGARSLFGTLQQSSPTLITSRISTTPCAAFRAGGVPGFGLQSLATV